MVRFLIIIAFAILALSPSGCASWSAEAIGEACRIDGDRIRVRYAPSESSGEIELECSKTTAGFFEDHVRARLSVVVGIDREATYSIVSGEWRSACRSFPDPGDPLVGAALAHGLRADDEPLVACDFSPSGADEPLLDEVCGRPPREWRFRERADHDHAVVEIADEVLGRWRAWKTFEGIRPHALVVARDRDDGGGVVLIETASGSWTRRAATDLDVVRDSTPRSIARGLMLGVAMVVDLVTFPLWWFELPIYIAATGRVPP